MASFTPDHHNTVFSLAADFIRHTGQHLFLTGKAGTGKTTFLRYIREHCGKKAIVAAPTGVAAINAGGVTLHSLFQLPFGPYVPGSAPGLDHVTDRHHLLRKLKLSTPKRDMLQEMELLIIDEVSMMRCDMLDACDQVLRHVRKNPREPFGGVQVLYIGDLFQLPPVVVGEEWEILSRWYESPFFFAAKVIQEAPLVQIELKKIYRQNEQSFINILNRIRTAEPIPEDIEALNARFDTRREETDKRITLTTHNRKADQLNAEGLERLPGRSFRFEAVIEKEFNENALPTERTLLLKKGAQVMFIRNDTGEVRRFYNGKLAVVTQISDEEIEVLPEGETTPLTVEKETWRNIRYQLNKEKDRIEEEEIGSFTQYPLRLAWAITIHKSQGLTFEKAVIDTGQAFSPGQVYVALSRCTSLEGIQLISRIYPSAIQTHPQVLAFAANESNITGLEHLLVEEKERYARKRVLALFEWQSVEKTVSEGLASLIEKEFPTKETAESLFAGLLQKVKDHQQVAAKFQESLEQLLQPEHRESGLLQERMVKAVTWFVNALQKDLRQPLIDYRKSLSGKSRIYKAVTLLLGIEAGLWQKLDQLQRSRYPDLGYTGLENPLYSPEPASDPTNDTPKPGKKTKRVKGDSLKETLDRFRKGQSIEEIADKRALSPGTIRSHLMSLIPTGEIKASELVDAYKLQMVIEEAPLHESTGRLNSLKIKFGELLTWDEIRIGLYHLQYLEKQEE